MFEGDARITLEQGTAQRSDVFAVDAFSSDAIPLHLLTLESLQTYLPHLKGNGILALHVANRFVDLLPIVRRLGDAADWVLLTRNQAFLDLAIVREDEEPMPAPGPLWTDDISSLWEVVELDN